MKHENPICTQSWHIEDSVFKLDSYIRGSIKSEIYDKHFLFVFDKRLEMQHKNVTYGLWWCLSLVDDFHFLTFKN